MGAPCALGIDLKEIDRRDACIPRPRATFLRRTRFAQEVRVSNRGAPLRGPAPPRTRVNGAIRAREVRLIGEDGTQLGVMSTVEALRREKLQPQ